MNKLFLIILLSSFYTCIRATEDDDGLAYFNLLKFTRKVSEKESRSESGPYEPLLIMQHRERNEAGEVLYVEYQFPTTVKIIKQAAIKPRKASLPTDDSSFKLSFEITEQDSQEIYLCPPEHPQDINLIEQLTEYYWASEYCLLPKTFENHELKECKGEVRPLIMPKFLNFTTGTKKCAFSKDFVTFAYPYCFDRATLEKIVPKLGKSELRKNTEQNEPFLPKQPINEIYGLCVDVTKVKTVYTHHQIIPSLLKHEKYLVNPLKKSPQSTDESEPKFFHQHLLSNMKTAFENQPDDEFHMTAQMLVPTKDMPFPLWKKTTYTYLNIAALWDPLVPLMDLINDRIRQMAIKHTRKLSIFSATFDVPIADKRYLNNDKDFLIPTIWNKLVYDVASTLATSIILHNTPNKESSTSKQMCAEDEKVTCYFEDWWETSTLKHIITKEQIQFAMTYAYCCQVSKTEMKFFGIPAISGSIVDMNFKPELGNNDNNDEITGYRLTNDFEELKNMLPSEEQDQFNSSQEKKDN